MALSKALYFSALLPPKEVREEVFKIKKGLEVGFKVKHALKLPAHITLLPPFWLAVERELQLLEVLNAAVEIKPFEVELRGFGRFGQRVIFIEVEDKEPIRRIHKKLLDNSSGLLGNAKEKTLHPHMTIATRDLTREKFLQVWPLFENKEFSRSFKVESLFLFRHNGKTWNIIKKIPFTKPG